MYYALNFAPESEGGYSISCRTIPELLSCGDDDKDAMEMAEDALICCVEIYFDSGWQFPEQVTKIRPTERLVFLPDLIYSKILLHNALLKSGVSKAELARRMGVTPQQLTPVFTVRHNTKLNTIALALHALGYDLNLFLTQKTTP